MKSLALQKFDFFKLIPFGVICRQRFSLSNWHYPCVTIFKTVDYYEAIDMQHKTEMA